MDAVTIEFYIKLHLKGIYCIRFSRRVLFYVYECLHVCMYTMSVPGAYGGQRRLSTFQTFVSCLGILGTDLGPLQVLSRRSSLQPMCILCYILL